MSEDNDNIQTPQDRADAFMRDLCESPVPIQLSCEDGIAVEEAMDYILDLCNEHKLTLLEMHVGKTPTTRSVLFCRARKVLPVAVENVSVEITIPPITSNESV